MNAAASEHLDLESVLAVLRRRWWVIVLLAIVATGVSFALSERQTKEYTATTSVLFENPQLSQQESGLQVTATSPSEDPTIMATNVQLLTQASGAAATTARILGDGLTGSAVSHAISVAQQGQTSVANVSATSTSPTLAASISNTYVARFIANQQAQQRASVKQALGLVQRQIASLSPQQLAGTDGQALVDRAESLRILSNLQDGGAQIVQAASPPTSASSPKVARNSVLGLLIGLLVGLICAFLLERFDRRIKNVEELETTYQLPLLATVPNNRSYVQPPQAGGASAPRDEVFPLLRAYLRYFNVDREVRSLLVASAAPGDGKTTISRNLAEAAQESGTKTLLVECDLRRPRIASHYGFAPSPGLSELLIGSVDAGEVTRATPIATRINGTTSDVSLDVLPAGHPPPNPVELIESKAMGDFLAWASEHYQLVVIDTPPLAVVSDAIPLLRMVDGVIIVSQLDRHTRDSAAFLRERLAALNAPLLGVVANGVKSRGGGGYGYGYGYGYVYGADPGRRTLHRNGKAETARPERSAT